MVGGLVGAAQALDDDALTMRLRELEDDRRRLEAETAVLLAELDARRCYRVDGHASMWGMLRASVRWSDRECRERMRIARLVREFPDIAELMADSRLPVANVAEIARGHANPRCGDQIIDVLGTLVTEAGRREYDDFTTLVRTWERLADVDGAHRDAAANHENRTASCVVWDGVGHLTATFGEVDGLANREIFERFLQREWDTDWAAVVAEHGDNAHALLMPRTPGQRRADALTAIFRAAASTPNGAKAPVPVLNVFVDHQSFLDLLAEQALLPEQFVDPFETPEPSINQRRCETDHGDPVDPRTAAQIAIDGHIRFVVLNDEGVPIRWGRTRRLFTGAARDAVMSLSHRCTAPGCRVPSRRCQADHTTPWSKGGRTDPNNGGPQCPRDNLLGNQGYTTTRHPNGTWHRYRPDGTEIR